VSHPCEYVPLCFPSHLQRLLPDTAHDKGRNQICPLVVRAVSVVGVGIAWLMYPFFPLTDSGPVETQNSRARRRTAAEQKVPQSQSFENEVLPTMYLHKCVERGPILSMPVRPGIALEHFVNFPPHRKIGRQHVTRPKREVHAIERPFFCAHEALITNCPQSRGSSRYTSGPQLPPDA